MIQQISLRAKVLATITSLLTLLGVVAYFGYAGLLAVTEIAGRTSAAHGIVESLLEARRHEKNLIIRADDAYRENALQAIAKVKQRASDLKDRSPDDTGRATMDAVIASAAAYESAFRELASAIVAGNAQASALDALDKKTVLAARATEAHCAAAISALSREMAEVSAAASSRILTLVVIALVLGIAAALLLVRDLRVSFARATASAQAMATGNLTQAPMPVGHSEIGRLGQAFNELRTHVESMLRSTTGTVATVAVSAQKVHSSAEEISETIAEVSLQVSSVASASTEMAGASEEIARNCEMAAQSAMSATQTALNGSAIVDRQIRLMRQIAGTVDVSSKSVSSLGERSVQIGTIIGTIHEIADQTNLLALNAAIEAARAGEQGRGFAVVADEVRKLAERTTKETQEISLMIKAIQEETESAVAAMQNGMRQVDAGTAEAANSEAALREIIAQIETVSTQVSHIAAAAEEQTAATEEISGNMHSIAAAVDKAANECRASTQVANGMTGVAEQLMSGMAQFALNEDTTLSLQKAKSAHMIFIGKIKAHLDGALKLDATALPTHLNCGFGKWYQAQANTSCGRMEVFKAIDAPHARVHQLGKQAVEAHAAGDAQQARALCNEMQACSMALVAMLDEMLAASCTSS